MGEGTALGALSVVVGGIASVVVAWISKPRDRDEGGDREQDLTTLAGIAAVVTEQQQRIRDLEAAQVAQREHAAVQDRTIGALRRYVLRLQAALRSTGAPVPEPDPDDADLIRG
ncbi:hypothetical protein [Streptomyces sp. NPDC088923]|uniref:hypothetical protein n=1 Tax=Streptomyces sp. NPDC088923 TaxID=3365913 RepID=UPI003810BED8